MLHLLVYDSKTLEERRDLLRAKVDALGAANFCLDGFALVHTDMLAWQVDGVMREILRSDEFAVFDITGLNVDRYFGRLRNKVNGRGVWEWIADNNS